MEYNISFLLNERTLIENDSSNSNLMALINCPECGKEISDKAENCPNCSYPLKAKIPAVKVESQEGCFLQTLNAGCIFIVAIIVVIFLLGTFAS